MQDPVNPGESDRQHRRTPAPVILAIDSDADVLSDIGATLRGRYGQDYRVECIRSPHEALARLERLAAGHEDVALVLAGETSTG